jgi:hypothetical protein
MSAVNVFTDLTNISVPNPITALAAYSQGTLPVYLFIGDKAGRLYIYDISYGTQKSFTVSGETINQSITGLAVSDQYLFVNSPGNCFQLPLYSFYPTTNYTSIRVESVANCYNRDLANTGGIAVTPDSRILYLSYGERFLSKIYTADSGSGAVNEIASIPTIYNSIINGVTIDIPNTNIYISDSKSARMYNYDYLNGNVAILSNIYFSGQTFDQFRGNAYSSYSGTLAYTVIDKRGKSGVLGLQVDTNQYFVLAEKGSLCNTNPIAYDTFGGLYMSTMKLDLSYTIRVNSYKYVPRPAPTVQPPRQQQYACGLILPGSCKRAYQPFNPRERFGWGSPNKPYRTLALTDIQISCPSSYVDVCPNFSIASERQQNRSDTKQQSVPPPRQIASAQNISRTRNTSTTKVSSLNINSIVPFGGKLNKSSGSSPVLDGNLRLYVSSKDGYLYFSGNYIQPNTFSNIYIGGSLNASPACSSTDDTLVVTSRPEEGYQGALTMVNGVSGSIIWQKLFNTSIDSFTPSYVGSNVFIAYGSNVTCFSSIDGSTVWNAAALTGGDTYSCSVSVQSGNVFVGTTRGSIYSYDELDGHTLLYYPANMGPVLSSPNVGIYNRVFFGSGSNLFAISLDRKQSSNDLVFTNILGNITSSITLSINNAFETNAFFTTDSNTAYCVNIDANSESRVTDTLILSGSSPVLDVSYMYVMGISGEVLRYQWNPLNFTNNQKYQIQNYTNGYSPSIIIDGLNRVIVAVTSAIITLS